MRGGEREEEEHTNVEVAVGRCGMSRLRSEMFLTLPYIIDASKIVHYRSGPCIDVYYV